MKVIENLLVSSKHINLNIFAFLLQSLAHKIIGHLLGRSLSQKNLLPLLFLFSGLKKKMHFCFKRKKIEITLKNSVHYS